MFKTLLLFSCLLLGLAPVAVSHAQGGAPVLHMQADGKVTITAKGKTSITEHAAREAKGKDVYLYTVDESKAEQSGISTGAYFFAKDGTMLGMAPGDWAGNAEFALISPGGKVVALTIEGNAHIFSFPQGKELGETGFKKREEEPFVLWNGDEGLLYTTYNGPEGRTCEYDPCGPESVVYYSFKDAKEQTVMPGTLTCDYSLTDFDAATGEVKVKALCLPSAAAWKQYPADDAPTQSLSVKLKK